MSSISSVSISGMNAAQAALSASAFNVANTGMSGFRRREVGQTSLAPAGVGVSVRTAPAPGDASLTDVVGMLQAKDSFLANLAIFKTSAQMAGSLLNTVG